MEIEIAELSARSENSCKSHWCAMAKICKTKAGHGSAAYDMWEPLSLTILICVHGQRYQRVIKYGGEKSSAAGVAVHMSKAFNKGMGSCDSDRWVSNYQNGKRQPLQLRIYEIFLVMRLKVTGRVPGACRVIGCDEKFGAKKLRRNEAWKKFHEAEI